MTNCVMEITGNIQLHGMDRLGKKFFFLVTFLDLFFSLFPLSNITVTYAAAKIPIVCSKKRATNMFNPMLFSASPDNPIFHFFHASRLIMCQMMVFFIQSPIIRVNTSGASIAITLNVRRAIPME